MVDMYAACNYACHALSTAAHVLPFAAVSTISLADRVLASPRPPLHAARAQLLPPSARIALAPKRHRGQRVSRVAVEALLKDHIPR